MHTRSPTWHIANYLFLSADDSLSFSVFFFSLIIIMIVFFFFFECMQFEIMTAVLARVVHALHKISNCCMQKTKTTTTMVLVPFWFSSRLFFSQHKISNLSTVSFFIDAAVVETGEMVQWWPLQNLHYHGLWLSMYFAIAWISISIIIIFPLSSVHMYFTRIYQSYHRIAAISKKYIYSNTYTHTKRRYACSHFFNTLNI